MRRRFEGITEKIRNEMVVAVEKKDETDLKREMRSDLELGEEEQLEEGLPPEEASYTGLGKSC